MPIYEYICSQCASEFEALVRGSESPQCPSCGGQKLEKQFSVPAAHVQGSSSLPMAGGCGLPQCGMGRCAANDD